MEGTERNEERLVDFSHLFADSGEHRPNIKAPLLLQAPVKPSVKLPEG